MRNMKLLALASALLPFAVVASAPQPTALGPALALCGYELSWADEFDEARIGSWRLDRNDWTAHTPWAGDFGDAHFADPGPDGPFSVRDGILRITARKDRQGKWTSGLIAAADETGAGHGIRYGYFEARMKLPSGPGTWPAFWLMSRKPRSDPRPSVELDGMEYYGHDPASYYATWHVHFKPPAEKQNRGALQRIEIEPGIMERQFSTIGILVTPETVTYLRDRVPVWRHPTPPEHEAPLFPLVNLALGSGYPIDKTPSPSVLEVDYVRIYAPAPRGEEGSCVDPPDQRPVAKRR